MMLNHIYLDFFTNVVIPLKTDEMIGKSDKTTETICVL
jgi:hypothetical protein